mgnify:CR=1 FL=1
MKKLTPLFERQLLRNSKNNSYLIFLEKILTIDKLKYWTIQKTYHYLDWKFENEFLAYRFQIFKKWILLNQEYTNTFVKSFEEIASALDLKKEFTAQEQNYIETFASVVFSKNRNSKNLIVDFYVSNNEKVWYSYEIISLFKIDKNTCIEKSKNQFIGNMIKINSLSGVIPSKYAASTTDSLIPFIAPKYIKTLPPNPTHTE